MSVLVTVHVVARLSFWTIPLVAFASAFSNVVGLKPVNCPWNRLKENWVRSASSGNAAKLPNTLPMARSLVFLSKRRAQAYLSGLVLLPNPAPFPDAKLPPMS